MLQAVKFGTRLASPRSVTGLSQVPGGFRVRLDDEHDIVARAVIIASGVRYRRLDVPGLAELEGRGVYYTASELEAKVVAGRNAVVVGGANSAGQAALFLARHAGQVHVLIRRDDLRDTMSKYLAQRLTHHERVTVHPHSELSAVNGTGRLSALSWRDHVLERDVRLDAAGLFLMIGADPCTTWLHEVGVELDAKFGAVGGRQGFEVVSGRVVDPDSQCCHIGRRSDASRLRRSTRAVAANVGAKARRAARAPRKRGDDDGGRGRLPNLATSPPTR
jgi:thioredoxin reductase (NADPH)